jgi:hypothetical protein
MKGGENNQAFNVVIQWPENRRWIFEVVEGIAKIRGIPVEILIPEFVEKELEGWDGAGELNYHLEQRIKRETKREKQ